MYNLRDQGNRELKMKRTIICLLLAALTVLLCCCGGKNDNTAERLAENCKVGDYIRIKGQLGINRYAPKNADKVQEKVTLTGWSFVPVAWDSKQNKYVDIETSQAA